MAKARIRDLIERGKRGEKIEWRSDVMTPADFHAWHRRWKWRRVLLRGGEWALVALGTLLLRELLVRIGG